MPENRPADPFADDVLTLEEAAKYLKVSSEEMSRLAEEDRVPAQRIGESWRFLKAALSRWLELGIRGRGNPDRVHHFPPFWFDHPILEEWLHIMRLHMQALQQPREEPKPAKGSKEALSQYFGILRGKENPEEILASLKAIRSEGDG